MQIAKHVHAVKIPFSVTTPGGAVAYQLLKGSPLRALPLVMLSISMGPSKLSGATSYRMTAL